MNNPTIPAATPTSGTRPLRITSHATQRYQERVDQSAPAREAVAAIRTILANGTVRAQPRHWTNCRLQPGQRLVYSAIQADACLLVNDQAVITVLTRDLCAPSRLTYPTGRTSTRRGRRAFQAQDDCDIYEPLPDDLLRLGS